MSDAKISTEPNATMAEHTGSHQAIKVNLRTTDLWAHYFDNLLITRIKAPFSSLSF